MTASVDLWKALDNALQKAIVRGDPPECIEAVRKARDQHTPPTLKDGNLV